MPNERYPLRGAVRCSTRDLGSGCASGERQLSEMLDQQFSENPDFPRGVLTGRPDDEHSGRRDGIARHHWDEAAGIQIALDEIIWKPGDAESCDRSGGESGAVVRLEPSLRMNGNRRIAIDQLAGFHSLHQRLVGEQIVRRFRRTVLPDIAGACN